MPIYEFDCSACGQGFERLQKIADPDPEACPACGATRSVHRRVSAPSFRLAGSGWYETDFKSDRDRKRNLAGSDSASPASDGGESGTAAAKADKPAATQAPSTPAASPAKAPGDSAGAP